MGNFENFEEQDSTARVLNCMEFILVSLLSIAVGTKCRSFRDTAIMGTCPTSELIDIIDQHHGYDGAECVAVALAVLEHSEYINIRESSALDRLKLANITEQGFDSICDTIGKQYELCQTRKDINRPLHNIMEQQGRLITVRAKPHGGPK